MNFLLLNVLNFIDHKSHLKNILAALASRL